MIAAQYYIFWLILLICLQNNTNIIQEMAREEVFYLLSDFDFRVKKLNLKFTIIKKNTIIFCLLRFL